MVVIIYGDRKIYQI